MRVALVSHLDSKKLGSWSGTLHFSVQAIDRHVGTVVEVGRPPITLVPFKAARRIIRRTTGKWYSYEHDPLLARAYGRYFTQRIAEAKPDLIFAPAASACLAFLETEVPIVYFSDATFRALEGYHAGLTNVLARTSRGGNELEQRAIARADLCLFSSDWAARSAIADYGADPAKTKAVYIGANLSEPPAREEVLPRSPGKTVRMLMVGVSWEHKGGQIALDALRELLARGYDAELTVVGCAPPRDVSHPQLRVFPFLNKRIEAEREQFNRLWKDATVFILPTRFDAAGVVFCEAAAYGLPSFGPDTGGVPDLLVDGVSGCVLPHSIGGSGYADAIAELVEDPAEYERIAEGARVEYERRLNWDSWGREVARLIGERLPRLESLLRDRGGTASREELGD